MAKQEDEFRSAEGIVASPSVSKLMSSLMKRTEASQKAK